MNYPSRAASAWRTAALTVLAPLGWGTTYITVTEFLPPDRPLLVAAVRVAPAGLLLVALGRMRKTPPLSRKQWRNTSILALFNFALFFPLLIVAVYRLPGGVAASAGGLQPLLVAILSAIIFKRALRPVEVLVGAVAAAGVALVVIRPGAGIDPIGVLAASFANVSFALGVVGSKRLDVGLDRIASTGRQLLLSAVILIPLAIVAEGAPPAMSVRNLAGFAYLSLATTAVGFVLWFRGIARLPVAAPPLLGLAAPLTGAAMGWLWLSEDLSLPQLTGFVITAGAILYGAGLGTREVGSALSVRPREASPGPEKRPDPALTCSA